MRRSWNWLILVGVAALTLTADRISKTIISNNLRLYESWHPPVPLLKHVFSLTHTTNTGVAFGLFPDQSSLFVIIAVVVITAIIYYYHHLPAGYGLVRLTLGLQLGGALGNMTDRLRQGYVTDFVDLNFWPLQDWPLFNVADSAIVVGVCLLAVAMLREDMESSNLKTPSPKNDAVDEPGTSS